MNINDIISFMTSPAVNLISELVSSNIFDEYTYKMNVNDVINILAGRFPLRKFIFGTTEIETENGEETQSNSQKLLNNLFSKMEYKINSFCESIGISSGTEKETIQDKKYRTLRNFIYYRAFNPESKPLINTISTNDSKYRNNLQALSDYIEFIANKLKSQNVQFSEFIPDLTEFINVYTQAQETSDLASVMLKFNQGLPSSKEEMILKLMKIQQIVSNRLGALGITKDSLKNSSSKVLEKLQENNAFITEADLKELINLDSEYDLINFNAFRWVRDEKYREATSRFYNIIKSTWSIFDMIDKIPHYNEMLKIFRSSVIIDDELFYKSHLLNKIVQDTIDNNQVITEQDINNLLGYIDDLLIIDYVKTENYRIPVFEGYTLFNQDWSSETVTTPYDFLDISKVNDIGSFKKLMEENLFDQLTDFDPRTGECSYKDVVDGKIVTVTIPPNKFLQHLVRDTDNNGQVFLRLNIDMQNRNASIQNQIKYQESLSDFNKLKNYTLGGIPLTDWFMLYNLVVHKNKFGRDRLTSLFGDFIDIIKEDSEIMKFLQKVGNYDKNRRRTDSFEDLYELGYNREDALFRMAPIVSQYAEATATAKIIIENIEGERQYKERSMYGYNSAKSILPSLDYGKEETTAQRIQRLKNHNRYNLFQLPFANSQAVMLRTLSYGSVVNQINTLLAYVKEGLLNVYITDC